LPLVNVRAIAADVDAPTAFERIGDFARYPEMTETVVSVEVDNNDDGSVTTAWAVKFRRGLLQWTEHDIFDQGAGTICFKQVSGDFASFDGLWRTSANGDGTLVEFTAEFDLGMPSLEEILNPLAVAALQENITRIMDGLLGPIRLIEPTQRR